MITLRDAIDAAWEAQTRLQKLEAEQLGTTPDELTEQREKIKRQQRRANSVIESGIPVTREDVRRIACGGSEWIPALQATEKWANELGSRPMLILCGPRGTGKTCAAGIAIASCGHGVAIKAEDLPQHVKPTPGEIMGGQVRLDLRAPLVVLDDLGSETSPSDPRFVAALLAFVEARSLHGRTIITANLRAAEFRERYDARTIDRLDDNATTVELSGPSLRKGGGGLK